MQPQADVIILTALKEEYDAVLEVSTGALPGSTWETELRDDGQTVSFRSFQGTRGGELRVAVLQAPAMGGVAAVGAIAPLVEPYKPRCLAMCGVCAGNPGVVELGDVIVADVLWDYDQGRAERTVTDSGATVERVQGRRLSYLLKARWKRAAVPFVPPGADSWLKLRPRSSQDSAEKPFRVHVGPLATGTKVQRGPGIFERLIQEDYKVLGLEMEAAALAAFAHEHELPHLVMKGVMDFADSAKNDRFKAFAARASAECLVAFLRENLPAGPADAAISEEALAAYKRALVEQSSVPHLELHGLANIEPGSREMKLELLKFAVAPSLHDGAHAASRRELEIQEQLARGVEDPVQRHALAQEREQLMDARWDYYAVRGKEHIRPHSFAQVLSRHERLVIVGDPGAGKSILLRLALLACDEGPLGQDARQLLGEEDLFNDQSLGALKALRRLLPVPIKLGRLGEALKKERGLSLEEFIRRHLGQHRASKKLLGSLPFLLNTGRIFLLCDGLDEVAEELRERVVQRVTALLEQYPDVRLLLTTRPYGYRPRVPGLEHARLAALSSWQQQKLVSRLHVLVEGGQSGEAAGAARARQRTRALLRSVHTRPEWQTLSSNPLLLTLSALTRTDQGALPRHRVIVYNNFVTTLLAEWRSAVPLKKAQQLLAAWASVAFELVRQEKHLGIAKAHLLRMLADTQHTPPKRAQSFAETALQLALERGLVREEEETVSFWHRTFGEFLAAYALTGTDEQGAASRILEAGPLPLPVLQFAAARLDHVLHARPQADALARGLLAQDERAPGRLLRPGLRQVSACLTDGVSFSQELVERVWTSWAELLAQTAPSRAWSQFRPLTQAALPRTLPAALVERFARLPDRGLYEIHHGTSLLVARLAREAPDAAREVCTRWMNAQSSLAGTQKFHGAIGLASLGQWSDEVIAALGEFREVLKLGVEILAQQVRDGGPVLRERLLTLAQARIPGDDPSMGKPAPSDLPTARTQEHERVVERRLSAAVLLAISGTWEENGAWVLHRALSGKESPSRLDELKGVLLHCATAAPVQASLLEWICDGQLLGDNARQLVREVAALVEDLPQQVLERFAQAEGTVQEQLEELLVQVGTERRSLLDLLWGWLEDPQEERRVRAARLLRKLARHEPRYHEALRRGMQAPEPVWRVRWAYASFSLNPELSKRALATLQDCARSPDPAVLEAVYGRNKALDCVRWEGVPALEGWLACALDPTVPDAARLRAAQLVMYAKESWEPVREIFYALLDSEDSLVRHSAAIELFLRAPSDMRVSLMAAERAAQTDGCRRLKMGREKLEACAREAVQAILRGLPRQAVSKPPDRSWGVQSDWSALLAELVTQDLPAAAPLIQNLNQPGVAGEAAEAALEELARKHPFVRAAIGERLRQAVAAPHPLELQRLVRLGLLHGELQPLAIPASRGLDPHTLSPGEASWLAKLLKSAHADEDALRFWRSALEGARAVDTLEAAAELAVYFPGEAGPWIQGAIARLLGSPEPSLRLDAARLALLCGVHEEGAVQVLIGCLELRESLHRAPDKRLNLLELLEGRAFDRRAEHKLLQESSRSNIRTEFLAMQTLYLHRPARGATILEQWLGAESMEHFQYAVEALTARGHSGERVSAALMERLRSAPKAQLVTLMHLAHEQKASPKEVLERLLARHGGDPEGGLVDVALINWLYRHPTLWAELRRQPPELRESFRILLYNDPFVTRDTVAFTVERALAQNDILNVNVWESAVSIWCRHPKGESEEHPRPSRRIETAAPEQVRGWLQELLPQEPLPSTLEGLSCFDRLAELAELPLDHRLPVLKRALEIDLGARAHEPTYPWRLELQATAALRVLKLGGSHGRLLPILQRAVDDLRSPWGPNAFPFASALLTYWPNDITRRQFVLRTALAEDNGFSTDQLLVLLEMAQLPQEERISLLCLCLGLQPRATLPTCVPSASAAWREHAPSLFAALENLGCDKARLASLLHEFVSTYGTKLSAQAQRALLDRPELTAASSAKLLAGVLLERPYDADPPGQRWLERFASKRPQGEERSLLERHWDSDSLSTHLKWLADFSQADEPEPVEQALCELTGVDSPLYRQARQRHALSDAQWSQLLEQLALAPEEPKASQFAKEWLLMSLWRTWESPAAV
ncbi:hypothetical protein [Hyalangium minutum]|uniref:NACHT domain-containing protein n=1 Tax=Hyalangium minutum TaxID=394096 RepID=A0A085WXV0_9BACT|nr:hypothetical protein [Hyalangium minutum]KFE72513.1 hypothetical protein DB31_0776 [Hyalangium minutum]